MYNVPPKYKYTSLLTDQKLELDYTTSPIIFSKYDTFASTSTFLNLPFDIFISNKDVKNDLDEFLFLSAKIRSFMCMKYSIGRMALTQNKE